jgi:hypothetical protein
VRPLLSSASIDGTTKSPNLPEIQKLLGNFSTSSIQIWLRMLKLTYSSSTREEIAKRVQVAIGAGQVSFEVFMEALIGIEESRSKSVHLVRVKDEKQFSSRVDKQLSDLGLALAHTRSLAKLQSSTPKMIYAINNHKQFRMKWGEVQTTAVIDRKTLESKKKPVPVIFVFILDKTSGIAQLRYESPEISHSHKVNGEVRQQAYYDFYREKCENMTGLAFESIDLRERLKDILLKQPPVVKPVTMTTIGEDQQTVVFGSRSSADPRTLKDFKSAMTKDAQPRTFEKCPMRWQHKTTNYKLYRDLWCQVDALDGVVRFDADCTEAEVDYVLSQFI